VKIAYLDCSSGISGDMFLGALADAGVPLRKLEKELRKIPASGYNLRAKSVKRAGFKSTKVDVVLNSKSHSHGAKKWEDIERLIKKSSLNSEIKQKGLRIFKRLFEAEAKVHGGSFDKVHLHELGAIDCVVDILGTVIGLSMLGVEKIYASPLNVGSGTIQTEHGILPVPAPATVEILKGVPVFSDGVCFELTTPTGAAIIKELSSLFGSMPNMTVEKIGIGAGGRDIEKRPNVLRILIGNENIKYIDDKDKVFVIETNIDDMNPQIYEHVMEELFSAGALDVFLTQIIMKKSRPGVKLTVFSNKRTKDELINIIFEETTTIGVRIHEVQRKVLEREIKNVNVSLPGIKGSYRIRVKAAKSGSEISRLAPEYEESKRLAKKLKRPLIEIMQEIYPQLDSFKKI
jgi:uncharacterized protein (TIGR00299 family) protein